MRNDDPRLETLAAAIADGIPVDWETAESAASTAELRKLVRNMRAIANVAGVHKTIDPDESPTALASSSPVQDRPASAVEPIAHWGSYALLATLGHGTQGVVYRALDTRLGRDVALKLRTGNATAGAVLHEARLLARLRHPNIVTVFGADEVDGQVGLAMELIHGATLDEIVRRQGPMNAREAALIGLDLSRALAAVHNAGLLHRDIKAQNVMRESGGRYVLMDFGTGREFNAPGQQRAGTPLYLAPEVLAGGAATVQSEVYSLGVLLFFLVTGSFPVHASSLRALVDAHRSGGRRSLHELRGDLEPRYVEIVDKATSPDPAKRFASSSDLSGALAAVLVPEPSPPLPRPRPRWWMVLGGVALCLITAVAVWQFRPVSQNASFVGGNQKPTIAVLPFEDLSPGRDLQIVGEGISDLVITDLGERTDLSVIARTTARQFVGSRRMLDLARELNVDAVVEGSLAPVDDGLRASVRIMAATSGAVLSSRTFTVPRADLAAVEREVVKHVAEALRVRLDGRDRIQHLTDPQAMEAYFRGWSEYWRLSREGFREAYRLFEITTTRAPEFASGYSALAYVAFMLRNSYKEGGLTLEQIVQLAEQARRLDPASAQAAGVMGWLKFNAQWDWPGAEVLMREALDLNPSDAQARWMYAQLLMALNRLDAALEEARLALRLDPLNPARHSNVATVLYYARRYDDAFRESQQILAKDPNATVAHYGMARFLTAMGRHDEAVVLIKTSVNSKEPAVQAELARILVVAGRETEAVALLPLIHADYEAGRLSPDYYAFVQLALGNVDRAIELLQTALSRHSNTLLWINVDPRFDSLRSDVRFTEILRRLGLAS